jgi:hypothetical protein
MGMEDQFLSKTKLDLETLKALKIYADLKCNGDFDKLYKYIQDEALKQMGSNPMRHMKRPPFPI